jgi:hypothetical protein
MSHSNIAQYHVNFTCLLPDSTTATAVLRSQVVVYGHDGHDLIQRIDDVTHLTACSPFLSCMLHRVGGTMLWEQPVLHLIPPGLVGVLDMIHHHFGAAWHWMA